MSSSFRERLQRKTLTNADQYRAMKKTLAGSESTDNNCGPAKEDWKNWELKPVNAGAYSDTADRGHKKAADAAVLQRALKQLEK